METIFGNPRQMTSRPPLQLSISTAYIVDICEAFINMLRSACQVTITETDLPNLVTATVMQVEAKVWFSQQGSPFATFNAEVEQRARRVKAVLPKALYPISFFIDQIGKFEMEQQIFVPTIHDLHLQLHPYQDVLPSFDTIVNQYHDLVSRVNYRVLNALAPVDYSQARGTVAQLVTSKNIDDTSVVVWSNRYIDNDALTCGAILRFGHGLSGLDDAHTTEHRCVEAVVEVAGSLQRFVRNIMNRLR